MADGLPAYTTLKCHLTVAFTSKDTDKRLPSHSHPRLLQVAQVYQFINVGSHKRAEALLDFRDSLFETIGSPYGPLFCDATDNTATRGTLEAALVHLCRHSTSGITRSLAEALVVLCDFHREHLDAQTIHKTWFRLEKIVRSLPETPRPIVVHHADARALPIQAKSIDMVLTSPPYINVHNYHQQFRRSVEALEWDVLSLARSEIGSNRQNRVNRFLTVIQYSLDMTLVLRELARVAKRDAPLILVVGRESLVRGGRFFNGELVAEIAVRCVGLEIERRQERMFRNRYGSDIYEDILHFRSTADVNDEDFALASARHIAARVLCEARPLISAEQRSGLDDAISRMNTVSPSPMPSPTALSKR